MTDTLKTIPGAEALETAPARTVRGFHLIIPLAFLALALAAVWVVSGPEHAWNSVSLSVVTFVALGKFVILGGITGGAFSVWDLALLVVVQDLACAYLLTFNLDYLYRLRRVGPHLAALESYGRIVIEERPVVRRLTFTGVVLFVMFPLTGTGSIGGSIFGRLLGMGRFRTLLGVVVGTLVGSYGMALLAHGVARLVPPEVRASLWFQAVGIAIVVAVIVWLSLRFRRILRKAEGGEA